MHADTSNEDCKTHCEIILIAFLSGFLRRRRWHPIPVLLLGKSHGWRSLVGCSPWGHEESDTTEQLHFHALEKEMATHPTVLAWRIPGTGEPGGLPSMGSHRVGHDWSDLAAAGFLIWVLFLFRVSISFFHAHEKETCASCLDEFLFVYFVFLYFVRFGYFFSWQVGDQPNIKDICEISPIHQWWPKSVTSFLNVIVIWNTERICSLFFLNFILCIVQWPYTLYTFRINLNY